MEIPGQENQGQGGQEVGREEGTRVIITKSTGF